MESGPSASAMKRRQRSIRRLRSDQELAVVGSRHVPEPIPSERNRRDADQDGCHVLINALVQQASP